MTLLTVAVPAARAAEDISPCSSSSGDYSFDLPPPLDGEMRLQPVTARITNSRIITFVILELPMSRYVQNCTADLSLNLS